MRKILNKLNILWLAIFFTGLTSAVEAQIFAENFEPNPHISSEIHLINQYIAARAPQLRGESLYQMLANNRLFVKNDSILVSFQVNNTSEFETVDEMNRVGARFVQVLPGNIYYSGFVQIDSFLRFPELFPNTTLKIDVEYNIPTNDDQGPAHINSITYETGGGIPNAGEGITIAILDGDWTAYNMSVLNGFAPSNFTYFDCAGGSCIEATIPGDNDNCADNPSCLGHASNSAQTVFDHAPAATYLLFNTPSTSARAAAILKAAEEGANLITCSQSGYITGWNDNTGVLCAAANDKSVRDMLMFFSAGNRNGDATSNGSHWQGSFTDSNGNLFHEWSGFDEVNNITTAIADSAFTHVSIQCNSGGTNEIYRVQFVNLATGTVVQQCSVNPSSFCQYQNLTGGPVNVGIRVLSMSSAEQPDFEMWTHDAGRYQYFSTSNQTSSPANCTDNQNILIIAAVPQLNFGDENPDPAVFSSSGPTNNMANSVKLTGPTFTSVARFTSAGVMVPGTYGGTSCATPNVAGAAAAFWSKHSSLTADQVRSILLTKARNYKDWGPAGYDDRFGHGGAFLFGYNGNNIYLNQSLGVSEEAPASGIFPWYSIKDINDLAPANRNVIMLTNDSQTGPDVIDKNMVINAAGAPDTSKRIE